MASLSRRLGQEEHAEVVQGVEILRVCLDGPAVEGLCFIQAACLLPPEPGLEEDIGVPGRVRRGGDRQVPRGRFDPGPVGGGGDVKAPSSFPVPSWPK